MKSFALFLVACSFISNLEAQSIFAGHIYSYTDIVPDKSDSTKILAGGSYACYQGDSLDIDSDGYYDILLEAYYHRSVCCLEAEHTISVLHNQGSKIQFALNRVDTVYQIIGPNNLQPYRFNWVAKAFAYGDPITKNDVFSSQKQFVYCDQIFPGMLPNDYQYNDFANAGGDRYVGLRYTNLGDTLLGWMRIYDNGALSSHLTYMTTKDYSFESPLVTSIDNLKGKLPEWKIYPNPANEIFTIETQVDMDEMAELKNMWGVVCKRVKISKGKVIINSGDLPGGIYYLSLESGKGVTKITICN